MSTKEDGYVGRINCICYKELSYYTFSLFFLFIF